KPLSGEAKPPPKETGDVCEKCGKPMVVRFGRRGAFAACSGYPDCRNTKSLAKKDGKEGKGAAKKKSSK
ncbi:MAG: topoisomerase DNA-binding C4 zinc finger domain-containing protein, partial [Planctomycetota bacterium]